jgi:hypothetical protein
MEMTMGLTDAQSAALAAVLSLVAPGLRGTVAAAINTALARNVGGPSADAAVLAAIGGALVRYAGV